MNVKGIMNVKRYAQLTATFVFLTCAAACSAPETTLTSEQIDMNERTGAKVGISEFIVRGEANPAMGQAISDIFTTIMFEKTNLRIVERQRIGKVHDEQKLSKLASGQLGLNAIILGDVTGLNQHTERHFWLLFSTENKVLDVTVDVRCVDVKNAEVLYAASGSATARQLNKLRIFGLGITESDSDVSEKAFRKALHKFLDHSVTNIDLALSRASTP